MRLSLIHLRLSYHHQYIFKGGTLRFFLIIKFFFFHFFRNFFTWRKYEMLMRQWIMSTNERRGNKFLSWELCDINMVRISVSIFDAKWCSDRIKILSSSFSYYNNSKDLRWQRRCFCNNFKLRFNQHPLPQGIYLTKKNDEKREEKRNESKNTSLQKLLLQKSLSSFCGENLWCLICNKFDDYNLIKYKEFKFERIFYFLCLWDEIRGVHLNGKMKKKREMKKGNWEKNYFLV